MQGQTSVLTMRGFRNRRKFIFSIYSEEVSDLYSATNIISAGESRSAREAGHETRIKRNTESNSSWNTRREITTWNNKADT
jgi:hypothetical protein